MLKKPMKICVSWRYFRDISWFSGYEMISTRSVTQWFISKPNINFKTQVLGDLMSDSAAVTRCCDALCWSFKCAQVLHICWDWKLVGTQCFLYWFCMGLTKIQWWFSGYVFWLNQFVEVSYNWCLSLFFSLETHKVQWLLKPWALWVFYGCFEYQ